MSDSKKAILARRARFVAAALAASFPAEGCDKDKGKPADEEIRPQACLKTAEGWDDPGKSPGKKPAADAGVPDASTPPQGK